MSGITIDLSGFPTRFGKESLKLNFTQRANFIYGRNGTGKTTIANEIKTQLGDEFDVYMFSNFNSVSNNNKLNAIALGVENAEIDEEVAEVDKEIDQLKTLLGDDKESGSLLHDLNEQQKEYDELRKAVDGFCTKTASKIKKMAKPQIAPTSYNRNNLKREIDSAKLLSKDEVQTNELILSDTPKNIITSINLPDINLKSITEAVNSILTESIEEEHLLSMPTDLRANVEKQNFAIQGLKVHQSSNNYHDELCAFCGSKITDERWRLLVQLFDNQATDIENRINDIESVISRTIKDIKSIALPTQSAFYSVYHDELNMLCDELSSLKQSMINYLDLAKEKINSKKQHMFSVMQPIEADAPISLHAIQDRLNKLIQANNELTRNLDYEQDEAKTELRRHYIQAEIISTDFDFMVEQQQVALERLEDTMTKVENTNNELDKLRERKQKLLTKTKDVSFLASKINSTLRSMGTSSFSLEHLSDNPQDKGYYQVRGLDGAIRDITQLSSGEKNIVAFLYFLFYVEEQIRDNDRPYIVVFDDPMNSNDSSMQYIMTSKLQKLYKYICTNDSSGYFILLTHNCHFYINVRKPAYGLPKQYGLFHLMTDGKLTEINKIEDIDDDFATSYELLWKELSYLYKHNQPDLMLNCCRRICETYINFNRINNFYGDNISAKKLFDVNQHGIDDFETEANGKTVDEIKNILYGLFQLNDAPEHFEKYWSKFYKE